jgi:hypothetical protein
MAEYMIHHSCGHTVLTELKGPRWRQQESYNRLAERTCPNCKQQDMRQFTPTGEEELE